MRWARACALGLGLWAAPLAAQEAAPFEGQLFGEVRSSVLIVDFDRLFGQSLFGQRVVRDYRTASQDLAAEQLRLAEALRAEELALAAQRPTMNVEVFRQEAEAFDEKARSIRRAQDAKVEALEAALSEGRNRFLEVSRPVLEQLLVENGATVLVERRSALLWLPQIDITDAAIDRINAIVGEGGPGTAEDP